MKMKAAVMTEVGKPLEIEEVELAEPKANEVLVRMGATSICHSDLNALHDKTTPTPTILGHEGAGIVEQVGSGVTKVQPGDKVALNWVPFCGTCSLCSTGAVHLCETVFEPMFKGTLLDGTSRLSKAGRMIYHHSLLSTFAEFTVVPEMSCVKLPDNMSLVPASLIGCGVATGFGAAIYAAQISPGSTVAVFGIGGVGVNVLQGAKIAGAATIVACDLKPANLALAQEFGATHTLNVADGSAEEALLALTNGLGVDYAIDCSGHTSATESAWKGTRRGGTVIAVGAFGQNQKLCLPANGFHRQSKVLKGSFYGDTQPFRDFPLISQLYIEGKLKLNELIIDQINLEQINQAFTAFKDASISNVGRQVITFPIN